MTALKELVGGGSRSTPESGDSLSETKKVQTTTGTRHFVIIWYVGRDGRIPRPPASKKGGLSVVKRSRQKDEAEEEESTRPGGEGGLGSINRMCCSRG